MLREAQIPFVLWLPAAIILHALGGGSATHAAIIESERAAILAFGRSVREDVRQRFGPETSVELLGDEESDTQEEEELEDKRATRDETDEADDQLEPEPLPPVAASSQAKPPKPPAEQPPPKPQPEAKKKPEAVAKVPPPKPKQEDPAAAKKKAAKKKPQQILELPKPDGRIAIINDPSLDKNQPDNPNARRIADHAHTTKEEMMARYRAYDQNASKPTGGGRPEEADPSLETPGNHTENRRGHSIENEDQGPTRPGSEQGPDNPPDHPIARNMAGSNDPNVGQQGRAGRKGLTAREAALGPASPKALSSPGGKWSISPDEGDGRKAQAGRKGRRAIRGSKHIQGVPSRLPNKYTINAYGLQQALGIQHLRKEQEKARNTRLSRHRGKFKGNDFQKYRAAIENYDPSVKPGNQTSLNAARVPFASYINKMHNRIHPIFADSFLGSLRKLGSSDRLSNMKLFSHVEMVLDGQSGKIIRTGVVKPSGVTAFDIGALSSLESAAPFGKPPDSIVSPDGKVYLHWEFYRDPYYACTSKFARPYLVKSPKKNGPATAPPTRPPRRTAEGKRYGAPGPLRPER
ncbi:MAG: hypothetical protein JRI68_04170 [Deltaproteobacteria bacterium]|nr:hypothetical protein [Deltaproteobacteria bacterium]